MAGGLPWKKQWRWQRRHRKRTSWQWRQQMVERQSGTVQNDLTIIQNTEKTSKALRKRSERSQCNAICWDMNRYKLHQNIVHSKTWYHFRSRDGRFRSQSHHTFSWNLPCIVSFILSSRAPTDVLDQRLPIDLWPFYADPAILHCRLLPGNIWTFKHWNVQRFERSNRQTVEVQKIDHFKVPTIILESGNPPKPLVSGRVECMLNNRTKQIFLNFFLIFLDLIAWLARVLGGLELVAQPGQPSPASLAQPAKPSPAQLFLQAQPTQLRPAKTWFWKAW